MATKEPWNNEIYKAMKEEPENLNRHDRTEGERKKPLTTVFLTFLVVIMFVLVAVASAFILGNSARQNSKAISAFNSGSTSSSIQKSSASQASNASTSSSLSSSSSSSSTSESSSSAAQGSSYTIVSGDTPSKIEQKTGVSWSVIASLNNITSSGYNADGSAIYAGQVIKLK